MRIYLDVCCFNRPFDDQTQEKIHLESEAVLIILSNSPQHWELVGSEVIDFEISKIPDEEGRKKVKLLTRKIIEKQKLTEKLIQRAKSIEEKGIKPIDSLHIASAEFLESDYMITTENKIIKKYQQYREFFEKIKIYNPISFLTEEL